MSKTRAINWSKKRDNTPVIFFLLNTISIVFQVLLHLRYVFYVMSFFFLFLSYPSFARRNIDSIMLIQVDQFCFQDLSWTLDRVFNVERSTLIYSLEGLPPSKEISSTTIFLRSRFSTFVLAQRSSFPSRLIALSHGSYCSSTLCTIKCDSPDFPFIYSHYRTRNFFLHFCASDLYSPANQATWTSQG